MNGPDRRVHRSSSDCLIPGSSSSDEGRPENRVVIPGVEDGTDIGAQPRVVCTDAIQEGRTIPGRRRIASMAMVLASEVAMGEMEPTRRLPAMQ